MKSIETIIGGGGGRGQEGAERGIWGVPDGGASGVCGGGTGWVVVKASFLCNLQLCRNKLSCCAVLCDHQVAFDFCKCSKNAMQSGKPAA